MLGEAMKWYDRSATQTIEGASLWNRKGIVASILRDFHHASSNFERAIVENKQDPAYVANLAVMYIMMGKYDQASAIFLQGMAKFSKNPYFLDQCAGSYYQGEKDRSTALDLIDQAVKVNTTHDPIILYHKHLILKALGRDGDARIITELILTIDPGFILSDQ
jgi:tetratricopeptide (TPR) repeat protein